MGVAESVAHIDSALARLPVLRCALVSDRRSFLKLVGGTALVASLPASLATKSAAAAVLPAAPTAAIYSAHAARLEAIDRARAWLNSQRDYIIRHELDEVYRAASFAQIDLGYANLDRQRQIADMSASARLHRAAERS